MSIRTFKIKHFRNLEKDLEKAYKVALFAQTQQGKKLPTSKSVKEIGLKAEISTQIMRKYHGNKKLKVIKPENVKLTVPSRAIRFDKEKKSLFIIPMKLRIDNLWFDLDFLKINQIELDQTYACVSVTFKDEEIQKTPKNWIGIDLNSTSHSIVSANTQTGNIKKYGKQIPFLKKTFKNLRKKNQAKGAWKLMRKQSQNEQNRTKDLLHKITRKIVSEAKKTNTGIRIEDLKGIRKNTKPKKIKNKNIKEQNFTLNSWPFYEFRRILTYKCLLLGIKLEIVNPAFTSQTCFKCKIIDKSNRISTKIYKCSNCEHLEHADVNAAFNIALTKSGSDLDKNDKFIKTGETAVSLKLPLTPREGNVSESEISLKFTK